MLQTPAPPPHTLRPAGVGGSHVVAGDECGNGKNRWGNID
jgi:hypothetical protein